MTVEELLERISAEELSEWEAFYQLEGKEHELVRKHEVDPETAHHMIWQTDGAAFEDEE